jgi:hypothetical protein
LPQLLVVIEAVVVEDQVYNSDIVESYNICLNLVADDKRYASSNDSVEDVQPVD